jgi:hypothetical protein
VPTVEASSNRDNLASWAARTGLQSANFCRGHHNSLHAEKV